MEFLEWLTGMGVLFGWIIPFCLGIVYINELKGSIFIGILIFSSAVPIEILCYRLNKRVKDKSDSNKKAILQEIEQKLIEAEKKRAERIKASPVRDLSPLQFEEFTKIYLKERNYKQVSLTRTSGDFGADVIAIAPDNVKVCVQCKKYSKPVGISAIQEVHSAKAYYKCERAAVVVASAGFTKQAIELSEKVNVSLFAYDDYVHEFKPMNHCAQAISKLSMKDVSQ